MELVERKPDGLLIQLSEIEAMILNNALNEICNGIEIAQFSSRLGCEKAEALELLSAFGEALKAN